MCRGVGWIILVVVHVLVVGEWAMDNSLVCSMPWELGVDPVGELLIGYRCGWWGVTVRRRGLIVVFWPTPRYVMGGDADVEDQEVFVCSTSRWVIVTEPKLATEVVLFVIRKWQAG